LRLTRIEDVPRQALGDRMVSFRVRLLKEGDRHPALAMGVHDIVGTRIFHAQYAVASKTLPTAAGRMGVHLGYGADLLPLRAQGRQFDGLFGGVSLAPHRWATLLAEYDGDHPNAGLRVGPVHGVALLAGLQNFDGLSAGVSYTFALH
ncbi:MAG TPA: YjbH domain-containing protein, partial [Longimicrobium sp.]|nr:YjbH domain-containing protein [Longimicrobium sp.]